MPGLLPSTPDVSRERDPKPRVIGLDSEDATATIAALSAETARELFTILYDEPATPSSLAGAVDTSLQNVQYHLEKLERAELIEEVDEIYSEKGREMSVYAPTNGPLVVFPGSTEDAVGLERLLKRVLGAIAALGIVSLLIEATARELLPGLARPVSEPADDIGPMTAAESPPAEPHWLVELVWGLPPGLLVFLGGMTVLVAAAVAWSWPSP